MSTQKVIQILKDATAELKQENDQAEAKWRERIWAEAWQKGLDAEYQLQVEFEKLIQHN